tara:strand:- start:960 stop:1193 length:234 start_codon:yes stop_codon:yes gene_type:complete
MINELISMNGYGFYVWSSFSFTLIGFGLLYFIIKNQLVKEQRRFVSKFEKLDSEKIEAAKTSNINKEILIVALNSKN